MRWAPLPLPRRKLSGLTYRFFVAIGPSPGTYHQVHFVFAWQRAWNGSQKRFDKNSPLR